MRAFCSWFNLCAADATPSLKEFCRCVTATRNTNFLAPFLSWACINRIQAGCPIWRLWQLWNISPWLSCSAIRCTLNGLMEKPVILDHVTAYWSTGFLLTKKRREICLMLSWQQVYFGVHTYSLWQGRALSSAFLIRLLLLRWWCLLHKWKIGMVWMRRQKHRLGRGREGVLQWCDSESACAVEWWVWRQSDMWLRLSLCIKATSMKAEWHVTQTIPVQLSGEYEGRVTCDSDSAWSMEAELRVNQTQPVQLGNEYKGRVTCESDSACAAGQWAWMQSHAQL